MTMSAVRIVNEEAARAALPLPRAREVVAEALEALSTGRATLPAPSDLDLPHALGEMHVKGAYLHGSPYFSYKAASGFYGNPARGLPVTSGLNLVFDARTGLLRVVILDNGYLTELRTGAAGALAAQLLAKDDVDVAGLLGSGGQARYQLAALLEIRAPATVLVHSRNSGSAAHFAAETRDKYGLDVRVVASAEELVKSCDLLITTTPAREPVVRAQWLHPGMHITAVGADLPAKQELEAEALARADKLVVDARSQAAASGELHHALAAGVLDHSSVHAELGEVVAGLRPGRERDDEITIADLTGLGVQDAAVANAVASAAEKSDLGVMVNMPVHAP
jgi:ornithine cyclodeaminase/alanine dehydrogenase-like protein (mu-crystallin family)